MNDTIVALATAHGLGAISIIRISGTQAYESALKFLKQPILKPRYAHFCKLYDRNDEFIDEAIVIYFKAPFSFTGEDVVEFQIHGGTALAQVVLEEFLNLGLRLAKGGEFSKRACLNGKMNVLKALNIQDLILAKSSQGAKIIARNLEGKLGVFLDQIRMDLVKTLAYVETSIDYADDDLPPNLLEQIQNMCLKNSKLLEDIVAISRSKKGLIDGFKIVILGKPNAGKSSILNALLNYDRAIVSDIAGTTRDRIEENLKIGTHLVKIIDTAGIRQSEDSIEQIGVQLSFKAIEDADIILAIFDASRPKDLEDEEILKLLQNCDKKIFWILNKMDLPCQFNEENLNFLNLSAKNDITLLENALINYLDHQQTYDLIATNLTLIQSCENASKAILRAKDLLNENSLELFAFEFNLAIDELAKFTKDFNRSEILDEMFGNFCLGK
ncbi:tRNA uridine-5-carboxymethylaminomethyl(34) synthesis GTPase MnmE [Campylobacter sp. US33a]|uniref:tRNA modification GTPase MnmE n=1 Tax=Campylobacter sp. CCS1377 TaxID=3158229 RepID=A0AAU7E5S1_9BACT|nr:tRNA uridine-5-carboxymethylaminomethyl(34) synthesis GTPase MnmE [Campylobacter sp. US33a]MCW1360209.1 tRNA uridine-5-carboxymethylaminomethyl(34) synthesis GTPase MnmE [Campylobacter jejuni]TEY00958.1 tRNA uridine-5-carboxymethylaminomethyl(34) synthesis GTPase MnmE [Campylobacter sp. US33a]